jgi:FMN phosphatase YigB (HAD superfamily)
LTSAIRAVLFDFAGTLFVPEAPTDWVRAVLARRGVRWSDAEAAVLAGRLVAAGRPGPVMPVAVPAELATLFAGRDLSAQQHRAAYTALMGSVPLPEAITPDDLYERSFEAAAWVPYADAGSTLRGLHEAGVKVAVVSNVGFDLRPIFANHGLHDFVQTYMLSYELGIMKPDPVIFRTACGHLGVAPEAALMVGDSLESDGAALMAGIRALLLPASAAGATHGLDLVLSLALSGRRDAAYSVLPRADGPGSTAHP